MGDASNCGWPDPARPGVPLHHRRRHAREVRAMMQAETARACAYCRGAMTPQERPSRAAYPLTMATRQHIIPRWRGGADARENYRPACFGCNLLLDAAADCPGTLACARAIAVSKHPRSPPDALHRRVRGILRGWVPPNPQLRAVWWRRASA